MAPAQWLVFLLQILPHRALRQLPALKNHTFYDRLFTPLVTLWYLLFQRLNHDPSLDAALADARAGRADQINGQLSGKLVCASTASYSHARQRLPWEFLAQARPAPSPGIFPSIDRIPRTSPQKTPTTHREILVALGVPVAAFGSAASGAALVCSDFSPKALAGPMQLKGWNLTGFTDERDGLPIQEQPPSGEPLFLIPFWFFIL